MWKYVSDGSFIPGVPAEDIPDAEFDEYAKGYAERHDFPADSLKKSGLWKHEPDKKGSAPAVTNEGE